MTTLRITVLALVQGVTGFLPVSSSGHLILVPVLTGWPDQGLLLDVAVHVGALGAVIGYFGRDIALMVGGLGRGWGVAGCWASRAGACWRRWRSTRCRWCSRAGCSPPAPPGCGARGGDRLDQPPFVIYRRLLGVLLLAYAG